ncbi:MAG TPA: hypothetical protein VK435_10195 [Thermodesulfovibrionales bacterium]|nr:hypothetical protein [Thermodesulfovibrionales bacterium]
MSIAGQWLWLMLRIQPKSIGFDAGLLTWLRERRHHRLRRPIHICLLENYPVEGRFGRFMKFWINERSYICSASLNERVEDADIVWVFSQDPLPPDTKEEVLLTLKKARSGAVVINHPSVYNSYHEISSFRLLDKVGIGVPRTEFDARDIGKTMVVYKMADKQSSPKFLSLYKGEVAGFRAFEFIDSRTSEGLYRKYRVLYIAGVIFPEFILYSDQWNVIWKSKKDIECLFEIQPVEAEMVHKIADALKIQYFTIDYVKKISDGSRVVTDVNVYPLPIAYTEAVSKRGYYGRWLRFDDDLWSRTNRSPGLFWNKFDQAMENLVRDKAQ